jgi:ParB-like chromosome segregation protein Spo0J
LVENAVREPLTPFDEARLAHMLVRDYRWTQQRVGDAMGITQPNVSTLIAIFDLDASITRALRAGRIDVAHARALLPLREDKRAQRRILEQILARSLSAAEAAALVAAKRHGRDAIAPARINIPGAGTIQARTTRAGRLHITLEAPTVPRSECCSGQPKTNSADPLAAVYTRYIRHLATITYRLLCARRVAEARTATCRQRAPKSTAIPPASVGESV